MKKYLVSVIIPTRNRSEYALECVKSVLNATSAATEIIVQDNSDKPELMNAFTDVDRVKYRYESKQLSFVDNFSTALKGASGTYICFIGDDDTVLSNIELVASAADANGFAAAIQDSIPSYNWPGSMGSQNGDLFFAESLGANRLSFPQRELEALLSEGCATYMHRDLARAYHGLVKKSLFDEYQQATSRYFGGLSPDIYSSICLSRQLPVAVHVAIPFSIAGACPKSGTAASSSGAHTSRSLEDAPHFKGHDGYRWDCRVPRFYSVETIWADSALHAINDLGYGAEELNVSALLAHCLLKNYNFKDEVLLCARNNEISLSSLALESLKDCFRAFRRRISTSKLRRYSGVGTLDHAREKVESLFPLPSEDELNQLFRRLSDE